MRLDSSVRVFVHESDGVPLGVRVRLWVLVQDGDLLALNSGERVCD